MEKKWIEQNPMDDSNLFFSWHNSHMLRAKAYELFKYHYEFTANDHDSIIKFLRINYNIKYYHVKDKRWDNQGKTKLDENRIRINNALKINNALFWTSDKRPQIRKR